MTAAEIARVQWLPVKSGRNEEDAYDYQTFEASSEPRLRKKECWNYWGQRLPDAYTVDDERCEDFADAMARLNPKRH